MADSRRTIDNVSADCEALFYANEVSTVPIRRRRSCFEITAILNELKRHIALHILTNNRARRRFKFVYE